MALQSAFKQFLAAPKPTFLADNASIHYITTLVTFNTSSEIIKHLSSLTRQLKKKEENFLDVIESENALAVEVETTIEFLTGGGPYLPGLDDNFLADRTVTFPIVCIADESPMLRGLTCVSFIDSHRHLQRQRKDRSDATKLGSRLTSQVD
jgi:hypothetical protein